MKIETIQNLDGTSTVRWTVDGVLIEKHYVEKPVAAVALKTGNAVLIVEPVQFPNNAVIYEKNGAERTRIINPLANRGAFGFTECGYGPHDELALIIRLPGLEFAHVIDEQGRTLRVQEIR